MPEAAQRHTLWDVRLVQREGTWHTYLTPLTHKGLMGDQPRCAVVVFPQLNHKGTSLPLIHTSSGISTDTKPHVYTAPGLEQRCSHCLLAVAHPFIQLWFVVNHNLSQSNICFSAWKITPLGSFFFCLFWLLHVFSANFVMPMCPNRICIIFVNTQNSLDPEYAVKYCHQWKDAPKLGGKVASRTSAILHPTTGVSNFIPQLLFFGLK